MKSSAFVALGLAGLLVLSGCGPEKVAAAPESTITPFPTITSEPAPTSTPVPPTPIPTIALPTVTPAPTIDPDTAFLDWLKSQGYEFLVDVNDGSKRYVIKDAQGDDAEGSPFVDIYSNGLIVDADTLEATDPNAVAYAITATAIKSIEVHGYDAGPVRDALQKSYRLPLMLQGNGYSFSLEQNLIGFDVHVTFFGP